MPRLLVVFASDAHLNIVVYGAATHALLEPSEAPIIRAVPRIDRVDSLLHHGRLVNITAIANVSYDLAVSNLPTARGIGRQKPR